MLEEAAAEFYPNTKFMRVECPKYPGFCKTRQKSEYPGFELKKQAAGIDGSQIAEVQAKLDILLGKSKKTVHFADGVDIMDEEEVEDVNYVGGFGFQGQRFWYNNNRNFNNNRLLVKATVLG